MGGEGLVEEAGFVAEAAGEGVVGDDAEADFVGDQDRGGCSGFQGLEEGGGCGGWVEVGEDEVAEPEGEAVDEGGVGGGEGGGEVDGGFDGDPAGGRAAWWASMRVRISASKAWAVAM